MSKPNNVFSWVKTIDWDVYQSRSDVSTKLQELRDLIEPPESSSDTSHSGEGSQNEKDEDVGVRVKLVVVGDGAVGKTSLLISYSQDRFPSEYVPTVFENYGCKKECEGHPVLLHLWDTAGQEDYDRLRPLSYPGSDVVLLIFATTSKLSFNSISDKWHPEIIHYLPHTPYVLVGSKIDIRDSRQQDPNAETTEYVTAEQGKELATQIAAEAYMELSSKTGQGLKEVFHYAMRIVLEDRKIINNNPPPAANSEAASSSSSSSASSSSAPSEVASPPRNPKRREKKDKCLLL